MEKDPNLNYDEMSDMIAGMMQSILEEYGEDVPDTVLPRQEEASKEEDVKEDTKGKENEY